MYTAIHLAPDCVRITLICLCTQNTKQHKHTLFIQQEALLRTTQYININALLSPPCYVHDQTFISCRSHLLTTFVFPFLYLRSSQRTIYLRFIRITSELALKIQPSKTSNMPSRSPQHVSNTALSTFRLFNVYSRLLTSQLSTCHHILFLFCHNSTLFHLHLYLLLPLHVHLSLLLYQH